ncbi:related to RRP15 Essential protein involved in pre-rRNA processing [Cephalotrichum gorgonifer]|uniref:Related to RRP15 Essential protein involved in pre-rRNA processing n=1 Tax=Cephalotrichum gorgonifer TaxID=2041049 RepID=A0AAE8MUY1_9PEZI|nr:related to RRP15 Essential protein involved in pre-rRNA processing [Cephalotrichum gorgonifer]
MVVDKTFKKRAHAGGVSRPIKKRRKQHAYHSDSEGEATLRDGPEDFPAVNLADSEDDIANAEADDGAATDSDASSRAPSPPPRLKTLKEKKKKAATKDKEGDDDSDADSDADDDDSDVPGDDFDVSDDDSDDGNQKRSKRNDPSAFATSLSKILSTKLSATKRADPVLSRSADAMSSARAATDSALEHKARKQLKEQKLKALEKGRVRDVMGGGDGGAEAGGSVSEVMEEERRLRKVAQRGVVKLFNAVRAAQVKAGQAERKGREDGLIGPGRREENVNEMSKKGFLDLIASGGK